MSGLRITIGNFLFKHRNYVFPLYILAVFLLFRRPEHAPNGSELAGTIHDLVAILVALSGLAVRSIVIGLAYIKRGGLNKKVHADTLVTEGMFAVCRNPLYVGNMLIYTGEFLMFGHYGCIVTGMMSFWCAYQCIIAAEENFLHAKFGATYDAYCRDVPRWWPKLSNLRAATSGMRFDWRKALFKDYSTICSTLTLLAFIRLWDILASRGFGQHHQGEIFGLAGAIFAILVGALAIRVIKKAAPSPAPADAAAIPAPHPRHQP